MKSINISEEQLRNIVSETVSKCITEGKLGDFISNVGMVAGESRYYFENNKKWAKRARKICNAMEKLAQYFGYNGEDEDCEGLDQAISIMEKIASDLESRG